ncbi:MAG: thioredoxin fold domain-containing protein [Candidatus Omnitrophica bacterium]|nr:thioredoxin fold domain-containing protein [Candidatus Omnitrophota bacterium]
MFNELLAFVGFYLAGLALNLTPCVYPMLSVTVSLFGAGRSADGELPKNNVLRATVYVLGMATTYSVLGAFASLTGGLFGSWLSNKFVLGGIGALMVLLALGMFGLYQLQLPSSILTRLSAKRGTGLIGMYAAGLVVGIFAAPCIGPPVVALLAIVAARGSAVYGFLAFFVLSLGLGTPYWLLGVFSGLLKKLPRSGAWLIWMERVFGVILLGAAAYFFALAFWPSGLRWVVPVTLILGGAYLGFIEKAGNEKPVFRKIKWLIGLAAVGSGIWFAIIAPSKISGIVWEPYDVAKFQSYFSSGQPVILDFYADWCIPCHEMDERTFSKSEVVKALESFKKMRVDVTDFGGAASHETTDKYHVVGVPTMIFFDSKGEEVAESRIVGFQPAEKFLETIKPALEKIRRTA